MAKDVCYRPPISFRSHDLHACDIKGVVGDTTMKGTNSLPCLVHAGCASVGLSLAFLFVFCVMVSSINFYWIFFVFLCFGGKMGLTCACAKAKKKVRFFFF